MRYNDDCVYVYQMKPQRCEEARAEGELLLLSNNRGTLDSGIIKAAGNIYSCMVYDKRRLITFITNGSQSEVINLIFRDEADYSQTLNMLKTGLKLKISVQDSRVISYARSISDKLRIGTEVSIVEAVKDEDFIICPACGVKNEKNSGFNFCLECGEPF